MKMPPAILPRFLVRATTVKIVVRRKSNAVYNFALRSNGYAARMEEEAEGECSQNI